MIVEDYDLNAHASTRTATPVFNFARLSYLAASIFLITGIIDVATLTMPAQPGAEVWRFTTVGAASNFLITVFFGALLASGTALYYRHRVALRVFALLSALAVVTLSLLLGDFVLNVLQLHSSVNARDITAFRLGSGKAATKYAITIAGFIVVGRVCWRAGGRHSSRR